MELDTQQTACVVARHPALFVVAGPGSGKTRTLVHIVDHALKTGEFHAREILMVTFTRMAAAEMKDRLTKLSDSAPRGITVGTFHAICFSLVCQRWREFGFSSERIEIIDRHTQTRLVKEAIMRARKGVSQKSVYEAMEIMGRTGAMPDDLNPHVAGVVLDYLRILKSSNAVDYGIIAYLGVLAAKQRSPGWRLIVVDEAQDLDAGQWEFFRLCQPDRLVCVGDPDQLIYEFRGAEAGLMRSNAKAWNAEIMKLERNYRSVRSIGNAANNLIQHNSNRIPKTIQTVNEDEGPCCIIDEDSLSTIIQELSAPGVSIAVLGRTHAILEQAASTLRGEGINFMMPAKQDQVIARPDVQTMLAFMVFPDMPNSAIVMDRVLSGCRYDQVAIEQCRFAAKKDGRSFYEIVKERDSTLCVFYGELSQAKSITERLVIASQFATSMFGVLSDSDFHDVARVMARFVRDTPFADRTPSNFMIWLNSRDSQDGIEEVSGVTLMTIHASKGLEFDHVIVVGCEEGIMPSRSGMRDPDAIEEERRLMFVAMTRGRKSCRMVVGRGDPSRFLTEAKVAR